MILLIIIKIVLGHHRPTLKLLHKHVRGSLGTKWYDLGVELLEQHDVDKLDKIKAQYQSIDECCTEMFKLWLKIQPKASWNQLIKALGENGIELHTLAGDIGKTVLSKG